MNLVVVDDDGDVRKALARLLRCLGHSVEVFSSVEDFECQPVTLDCAIVDIRMPGQSGIRLCEKLRARDLPIPVVLISGESGGQLSFSSAIESTPSIAKPFDSDTLVDAIAAAVSGFGPRERHAY